MNSMTNQNIHFGKRCRIAVCQYHTVLYFTVLYCTMVLHNRRCGGTGQTEYWYNNAQKNICSAEDKSTYCTTLMTLKSEECIQEVRDVS